MDRRTSLKPPGFSEHIHTTLHRSSPCSPQARKYTKVILMDHLDWMDDEVANGVAQVLAKQVLPGGIVIWRSAALTPPYASLIAKAGFDVRCISRSDQGYMDRVNMYSSFYVATKKAKRE